MTYLAEAHAEWHIVNGPYGCPLDCGRGEYEAEATNFAAECEAWERLAPWWWDSESYGDEWATTVPEEFVVTVTPQDLADLQTILDWEAFEGFGR